MHILRCTLFAISLACIAAGCGGAQKPNTAASSTNEEATPASTKDAPGTMAPKSDTDADSPAEEETDRKMPEPETKGIDPCDPGDGW